MKAAATPKPAASSAMSTAKAQANESKPVSPPVVAKANAARSAAPSATQPAGSKFKAPEPPSLSPGPPQAMSKRLDKTP